MYYATGVTFFKSCPSRIRARICFLNAQFLQKQVHYNADAANNLWFHFVWLSLNLLTTVVKVQTHNLRGCLLLKNLACICLHRLLSLQCSELVTYDDVQLWKFSKLLLLRRTLKAGVVIKMSDYCWLQTTTINNLTSFNYWKLYFRAYDSYF